MRRAGFAHGVGAVPRNHVWRWDDNSGTIALSSGTLAVDSDGATLQGGGKVAGSSKSSETLAYSLWGISFDSP